MTSVENSSHARYDQSSSCPLNRGTIECHTAGTILDENDVPNCTVNRNSSSVAPLYYQPILSRVREQQSTATLILCGSQYHPSQVPAKAMELLNTFPESFTMIQYPTCWEDLYIYFDLHDLALHTPEFLWYVLICMKDICSAIRLVLEEYVGLWALSPLNRETILSFCIIGGVSSLSDRDQNFFEVDDMSPLGREVLGHLLLKLQNDVAAQKSAHDFRAKQAELIQERDDEYRWRKSLQCSRDESNNHLCNNSDLSATIHDVSQLSHGQHSLFSEQRRSRSVVHIEQADSSSVPRRSVSSNNCSQQQNQDKSGDCCIAWHGKSQALLSTGCENCHNVRRAVSQRLSSAHGGMIYRMSSNTSSPESKEAHDHLRKRCFQQYPNDMQTMSAPRSEERSFDRHASHSPHAHGNKVFESNSRGRSGFRKEFYIQREEKSSASNIERSSIKLEVDDEYRVYAGNLPAAAGATIIRDAFAFAGTVSGHINLHERQEDCLSLWTVLKFQNHDQARNAVLAFNDNTLPGTDSSNRMVVTHFKPRAPDGQPWQKNNSSGFRASKADKSFSIRKDRQKTGSGRLDSANESFIDGSSDSTRLRQSTMHSSRFMTKQKAKHIRCEGPGNERKMLDRSPREVRHKPKHRNQHGDLRRHGSITYKQPATVILNTKSLMAKFASGPKDRLSEETSPTQTAKDPGSFKAVEDPHSSINNSTTLTTVVSTNESSDQNKPSNTVASPKAQTTNPDLSEVIQGSIVPQSSVPHTDGGIEASSATSLSNTQDKVTEIVSVGPDPTLQGTNDPQPTPNKTVGVKTSSKSKKRQWNRKTSRGYPMEREARKVVPRTNFKKGKSTELPTIKMDGSEEVVISSPRTFKKKAKGNVFVENENVDEPPDNKQQTCKKHSPSKKFNRRKGKQIDMQSKAFQTKEDSVPKAPATQNEPGKHDTQSCITSESMGQSSTLIGLGLQFNDAQFPSLSNRLSGRLQRTTPRTSSLQSTFGEPDAHTHFSLATKAQPAPRMTLASVARRASTTLPPQFVAKSAPQKEACHDEKDWPSVVQWKATQKEKIVRERKEKEGAK